MRCHTDGNHHLLVGASTFVQDQSSQATEMDKAMNLHTTPRVPPRVPVESAKKSVNQICTKDQHDICFKSYPHCFLVGGFNPFENISQIGNLPEIGVKIKHI